LADCCWRTAILIPDMVASSLPILKSTTFRAMHPNAAWQEEEEALMLAVA
jgi:hypothetical protein